GSLRAPGSRSRAASRRRRRPPRSPTASERRGGAVVAVTPETIAVALGRTTPESGSLAYEQWLMWIDDALMLINARKTELAVTTDLDANTLDYVVREAVAAHVRRPDDATQVTVSVDDGSMSKTYRSGR